MNILISNDDGILAHGLSLLGEAAGDLGRVTVVAPDREQSATSHSLTLHRPIRATRRADGAYQVDGTPTDCVLLALSALMP
ncbi:MAG: 5'/3'-nucleotidase SurE, partial [Acidobacteriota bacterium]